MGWKRGWGGRVREIGEAFLGVLRAEVAAVGDDLSASGRALVRALLWVAIAFGIGFWSLGLLLAFAVELIALRLPRWGAVGIVLGIFVLLTLIFVALARARFRSVESPAGILRRRYDDHRRWWRESIAEEAEEEPGGEGREIE